MRALGAEVAVFGLDQIDAALAASPTRLAVAGGDGSLGQVAAAAARAEIPLAVIPTGTANDFARAAGHPARHRRGRAARRRGAASTALRPRAHGRAPVPERRQPRPVARGRRARIRAQAGARRRSPTRPARCAPGSRPTRSSARSAATVSSCFEGEAWQVTVACTGAFGAGSSVEADPADGRLDVVAIEAESAPGWSATPTGFAPGRWRTSPASTACAARQRRSSSPTPQPFNVDGELIESGTCRFEVEPAAVA